MAESIKVVLACSAYPPNIIGGGEISTQNLVQALAAQGVNVVVLTVGNSSDTYNEGTVRVIGIKAPNIYWSFNRHSQPKVKRLIWHLTEGYNVRAGHFVEQILRVEKPDVFHTSTIEDISPYSWKVAKAIGTAVVHTLRSYSLLCNSASMFKSKKNCKGQCTACKIVTSPRRMLSKNVDVVVGNSQFILDRHLDSGYFSNATGRVVYNIYETPSIKKNRPRGNGPLKFGYLGRLDQVKGIETMLSAFGQLRDSTANWSLSIAGTGNNNYVRILHSLFDDPRISWVGKANTAEFLDSIDVLVLPSLWHEPLARVIFEAYAHGVPVIGANTGGTPEILNDGTTGFIYDAENSDKLSDIVRKLIDDRRLIEKLANVCRAKAGQFGAATIAKAYIKTYEDSLRVGSKNYKHSKLPEAGGGV